MKRGEVWLINLDPTIGAEIKKSRPCVIVNNDIVGKLALKVIVPITEWEKRYELADWQIHIMNTKSNGLIKESSVDTFQIRSLSERRFIRKLGTFSNKEMRLVENGMRIVLNLGK